MPLRVIEGAADRGRRCARWDWAYDGSDGPITCGYVTGHRSVVLVFRMNEGPARPVGRCFAPKPSSRVPQRLSREREASDVDESLLRRECALEGRHAPRGIVCFARRRPGARPAVKLGPAAAWRTASTGEQRRSSKKIARSRPKQGLNRLNPLI